MHHRRANSRSRDFARRLPAVLLSGLFMIVTAGLPALAGTAHTRELTVEAKHDVAGTATLSVIQELPEVAAAAPTLEAGLLPPSSAGTAVSPLDLYLLENWGSNQDGDHIRPSPDSAHPDRAPPVAGQL